MKKHNTIFRAAIGLCLSAMLLFSCDKPFEMNLPLAVNSHKLTLSEAAGSTHILIWSDGNWTASFGRDINWGSLNKREGTGNSDLEFSYSANYGVTRSVELILAKADLRDTILLVQNGSVSGDEVSLSFRSPALNLLKNGYSVESPIATSLIYSTDMIIPQVEFFDAEGVSQGVVVAGEEVPDTLHITPWISNIALSSEGGLHVAYDVADNTSGMARSAVLSVNVEAADGTLYSSRQTITQGIEEPALELAEAEGEYSGFNGAYTIAANVNNVYPYTKFLSYSTDADWITSALLNAEGLVFVITRNDTGSKRTGTINVTFNDGAGNNLTAKYKITQSSYPGSISFSDVRALTPGEINQDKFIEGFIVSDPASANVCQSPQTAQFKFDFEQNYKTAYIESVDGKYGFRLLFATREDNITERWSRVRININGLTLVRQDEPLCYSLEGLTQASIIETVSAPDEFLVPAKKKSIAELTDDDIFTLVSLQNVEIMCKDGSYTNCTDGYSIKDPDVNPLSGATSPRWDTAPLLLSDTSGNSIYMLTNAMVPWRRNGTTYGNGTEVVAQGSGSFRGIVTPEELVRYGELGRYKIRPMAQTDIQLSSPAFSKTIVEWNWNDKLTDLTPEIGAGELNLYGATIAANSDFNSMMSHEYDKKGQAGLVPSAAIIATRKWWDFAEDKGEYFDISFSTAGISGSNLVFGIVWNHGQMNNSTLDSPAHWNLLYSTDDGHSFKPVPGADMIKNRSIVWWTTTSQDACPGFKDHMRKLPSDCFGKEKVILRMQVADKVTDKAPATGASTYLTNLGIEQASLTDKATGIRIGTITVRYN
ncbi:MAG: BACON domain-containing protein [Bacteroidales bacterium]|nr:BACON domain-containing protein [Bacteroidales bacterium]